MKSSLRASLTKILTNSECPDLIQNVLQARAAGKPYILTFIGVNGVGKSTNLAKVAYLLKNNGFSVMLVACDNFRAGAVEQIKQHGRNLGIQVYDRGYKEDAADIAFKAVQEATQKKIDVVLIDTAGRMQDNEPLMKALSRLVAVNTPDMVIFIGEALAGNDSIDQLKKFNKSLLDMANRPIDAVILSKFDTVDDKSTAFIKVGTAISMTYCTGKPILFVGVGQKYPHLRKLNARLAVNALLS